MMRWWFWSILALIPNLIFAVKSSDDPFGGAICENTVSAFFVSDNTNVVWEGKVLLIDNITEDQCKEVCINNKDIKGRSILCASFTYDHVSFQCNIYRHRSLPDGTMARQYSPGKRYFEKFCIAEDLPVECANTMFIRADESIIKGYAKNTSIVPSMEECASRCLREEFDCKSAMYFYEEGECITNIESAMTKPEDFGHPDDGDRVVYFQNGCTREFINTLGQDSAKASESETLFEATTTEESVSTTEEVKVEETEAPSTTTEAPVETTEEAVEEKPVKPRKNKGSRRRGSAEIGSEEAPVPDQAEQEPQPAEPPATSAEIPPKEFPPPHSRKIKADSSEKSPPKQKKSHDSAEEEEKEPESIPQEPEAEPTTEQPESSTGALKDMEKELLELLNESSAAAADLGNDESDQEQEKPQPKKEVSKKSKKKGEARHKSSDEEALKEMQEIREMLKNRKEKNEDDDKQRKVKAHDEDVEEAQSEEVTQEPPTKRPISSKRKQHRSEEEEEPKPREQEEEEVKEKAVEEEEKPLERKPKSEESVEEEQQEARPKHRSSKPNGVKKPLYAAKQLRHMSDGSLREISKEQEAKISEEVEPRRPKDPSPEEGHREPLPTAAPEKEELKAIRPTRVRKLGLKLNGEPRKINIRPLRTQSGEDGHDFTDPARERAQEDQQEERDEVDGYFSKWGDWTKCTHPGERRLRRRKCLDLKKCKGSLMQVSYCPKDLPAEVAPSQEPQEEQPQQKAAEDEPARPVRKPLPVEGVSSESGHPPGIMPPEMAEKELKPLPVGAPGNSDEVWSPWLGVCQQFASTQPCKNGKVIGFESRECVAKDPKLCKGPFFRYCTLKC